jgi:hypothetical protein
MNGLISEDQSSEGGDPSEASDPQELNALDAALYSGSESSSSRPQARAEQHTEEDFSEFAPQPQMDRLPFVPPQLPELQARPRHIIESKGDSRVYRNADTKLLVFAREEKEPTHSLEAENRLQWRRTHGFEREGPSAPSPVRRACSRDGGPGQELVPVVWPRGARRPRTQGAASLDPSGTSSQKGKAGPLLFGKGTDQPTQTHRILIGVRPGALTPPRGAPVRRMQLRSWPRAPCPFRVCRRLERLLRD